MCTAATYTTKDFYFGRTLDYEFTYGEQVTITPRNYPFHLREEGEFGAHFAMIGMAHIAENYPLYYDAVNEKGLGMAGLNFVGNAVYHEKMQGKYNLAQFELIPYILGRCSTLKEAVACLKKVNILNTPFGEKYPLAQLHWLVADKTGCVTVESTKEGLKIYRNPAGVLTNNPPFEEQMHALSNYMQLTAKSPKNSFAKGLGLKPYSRGMGALGLPGDLSSQSRFVRAAFVRGNSVSSESETDSVGQFFHILGSVEQQRGCCQLENREYQIPVFTSCCTPDKGIYYYTTYGNRQITAVDMRKERLDGSDLICYPLILEEQIKLQN